MFSTIANTYYGTTKATSIEQFQLVGKLLNFDNAHILAWKTITRLPTSIIHVVTSFAPVSNSPLTANATHAHTPKTPVVGVDAQHSQSPPLTHATRPACCYVRGVIVLHFSISVSFAINRSVCTQNSRNAT